MTGVDDFVANNLGSQRDTTFDSCVNLIVYAYSQIQSGTPYSRNSLKSLTSKVRGRATKRLELEDYLRNDLVAKYINPNRVRFNLGNYLFISGAEEFYQNIKIGILDIKVCSPLLDGSIYYVFECKRMNAALADKYVTEGVVRFLDGQYYPNSDVSVAGMISFLEAETPSDQMDISSSFVSYQDLLTRHGDLLNTKEPLAKHKLSCDISPYVNAFEFVYQSTHGRSKGKADIEVYHIVLDYNSLVTV